MTSFFGRFVRGVEAAQARMGSDELARTNGFPLTHSAAGPVVVVRRRHATGEIVVDVVIGGASATMTPEEFSRFADELAAFRAVVDGADAAARRADDG